MARNSSFARFARSASFSTPASEEQLAALGLGALCARDVLEHEQDHRHVGARMNVPPSPDDPTADAREFLFDLEVVEQLLLDSIS